MSAADGDTLLFVYGTLMRGEAHHHLLEPACFVEAARTRPGYDLVDLRLYPALVRGGATVVHGELWRVDARLLSSLDRFEGHPEFYRRETIELEAGGEVSAYLLPAQQVLGLPRISSGDWRAR